MNLFTFQSEASTSIAKRFAAYLLDPLMVTKTKTIPFFQNLNAITGSGKTLILADTIAQMRSQLPAEPIVLWLSKGKVVVWQTYANLSSGKYHETVGNFVIKPLSDCRQKDIEDSDTGLLLVATVGKFNNADKEQGDRKVFQLAFDFAEQSLWDMLKERRNSNKVRRPFIVVYDEGHNLTDQQTKLLLDLEPDALIVASATMKIPNELGNIMARLRQDKYWKDDDFITVIKSGDVVDSGLIKEKIMLGGYVTPMEVAIDDMIENLKKVEQDAGELGLKFKPKAIYVSNTNTVTGQRADNIMTPFEFREARPILIWRHLTEHHNVDPKSIAVYCNLKFDNKYPPPLGFNLFSGGDNDYENFTSGHYQHIIFNLTLQEGWDDPSCYFAYIDKDMGSRDQITQIIGRVLRQPSAQHYSIPSLNTAHFFIRTDERRIFDEVLNEVKSKIAAESPEITLTVFKGSKGSALRSLVMPKKVKQLPEISIDASHAFDQVLKITESIQDYRQDTINTVGKGSRIQVLQKIGVNGVEHDEWVELEHSNKVTARWVFSREVQKTYAKALNICDIENAKFDALIEYNSKAAEHLREYARKVVDAYLEYSDVVNSFAEPIVVPGLPIDPSQIDKFTFSIHEGYSGLNSFELDFAKALDKTQRVWMRNPARGLFEIPLLSLGNSKNFNPDFIVWADKDIVAIDTKGDHLIFEDACRKVLSIGKVGSGPNLLIRLVSRGRWNQAREKLTTEGFTVWALKLGKVQPFHVGAINEIVSACLKLY